MSKPIKEMIVAEYRKRFAGVEGAVLIELRGVDGVENNRLRLGLRQKAVRVTVVKNSLAKRAFAKTALESLSPGLTGQTAVVYGSDSVVGVARDLVKWAKDVENLSLKGACLEGIWFAGKEGVERLASFPTKAEAQAKVIALVLSPARNLVGAVKSPGARVLGIVKEIERRLEKGEALTRTA